MQRIQVKIKKKKKVFNFYAKICKILFCEIKKKRFVLIYHVLGPMEKKNPKKTITYFHLVLFVKN